MKTMQFALLPVAITFALAGCGGSGGGSSHDSNQSGKDHGAPTYEVAGALPSAVLSAPFTACADFNRNWECDSNEPTVRSEQPTFTLVSTDIKVKASPLLVKATMNQATDHAGAAVLLVTPAVGERQSNPVNGITTLVMGEMLMGSHKEQAIASVAASLTALGLTPPADLLGNSDDAALAELDEQLVTVLAKMAMRTEPYDKLVGNVAKGLAMYGRDILAGTLTDAQYDELARLGVTAGQTLNDTGLSRHLNLATGQMTAEPDPGAPGQDASYGLDVTDGGFQFTKLDSKGQPLPVSSTTWQCVRDERTGLIWEHKADDARSYRDKNRMFAFETASHQPHQKEIAAASCQTDGVSVCTTQEYVTRLNQDNVCGKSNWRLPTLNEQYDLLDFGETAKDEHGNVYGLDVAYFDDLVTGAGDLPYSIYWSATTIHSDPSYTSGRQIPLLSQMSLIEDQTMLGDINAGYSVCDAGQTDDECSSPTVILARMVAQ
ncbi:Lcl C-terminal domain-containing protein [Photobacterium ganghwense]|uniref:Lcl C-terminal domain-containing protein n=1 Tax=Photobacterium ganghwense TaxID=320778 RepID=UPI001C2D41C5|nr:DUF1566 domain-containing protein [Photobacterium ganghwense]MBV1842848.1 DUF1566 domain-containing protein [Photobacterium ganghwense]